MTHHPETFIVLCLVSLIFWLIYAIRREAAVVWRLLRLYGRAFLDIAVNLARDRLRLWYERWRPRVREAFAVRREKWD